MKISVEDLTDFQLQLELAQLGGELLGFLKLLRFTFYADLLE